MSGGYARIVRSVKPAGRRAYVPEWGMILGNDGVRGSGALSYELYARRLEEYMSLRTG